MRSVAVAAAVMAVVPAQMPHYPTRLEVVAHPGTCGEGERSYRVHTALFHHRSYRHVRSSRTEGS